MDVKGTLEFAVEDKRRKGETHYTACYKKAEVMLPRPFLMKFSCEKCNINVLVEFKEPSTKTRTEGGQKKTVEVENDDCDICGRYERSSEAFDVWVICPDCEGKSDLLGAARRRGRL